jgi:Zn-dependent protease with chaperone function
MVLGHELGHFKNRDHLRRVGRGVSIALLIGALTGLTGAALPGPIALVEQSAGNALDREHERAADLFSLDLVEREYGHLGGAFELLEHLAKKEGAGKRASAYLASHPASSERVALLREVAIERGYLLDGAPRPLPRR